MSEMLTKSAARNIFYGGSIFFFAVLAGLTAHSHIYVLNTTPPVTDAVARGKHVWEKHSCINCHTILGEGAYFAPEVGNVLTRWGGDKDMKGAKETLEGLDEVPAERGRRSSADAEFQAYRQGGRGPRRLLRVGRQDQHPEVAT